MFVARNEALFTLGLTALLIGVAVAGAEAVHPVLERYPSREALQQRIDEAKRTDSEAFEAAKQNFDRAIWGPRSIIWPSQPKRARQPRPIKESGPQLDVLMSRYHWELYIAKLEQETGKRPLAAFYRDHLEEFCIDEENPMLELALIDVVLNGWDDWTHWDHEKLVKLRDRYPGLHRVYAIRELQRLKDQRIGGVLLQVMADSSEPSCLIAAAEDAVRELVTPEDSFEFLLHTYLTAGVPEVRTRLEMTLPGFSHWAGKSERVRNAWRPYLDSEIPLLRFEARKAFDLSVPGLFERNNLHEEWVAEHDPDPGRRETAREHLRVREISRETREHTP